MFAAAPQFPPAMLPYRFSNRSHEECSNEQTSPYGSLSSTGQHILVQEHVRLNQYTPPPSPEIRLSRASPSMRSYSSHLLPGTSQYSAAPTNRIYHQRASSGGRTSTTSSPNISTPNTPHPSDHYFGSHSASDFAASRASGQFVDPPPHDVDFPTGQHVAAIDNPNDPPFPTPTDVFPEYHQSDPNEQSVDHFTVPADDNQAYAGDFSNPPYPDPDGISVNMHTVNPYMLWPPQHHHISLPYPLPSGVSEASFEQTSYDSDMSDMPVTPVDDLGNGFNANCSLQEPMPMIKEEFQEPQRIKQTPLAKMTTRQKPMSTPALVKSPTSPRVSTRRQVPLKAQYPGSLYSCGICSETFETETRRKKHTRKIHEMPYVCIFRAYGCKEFFGTKNEWVRHVRVQHLRLETWRCELDTCSERGTHESMLPKGAKRTNDYGRKDLFLEHVRRIHKPIYHKFPEGDERKEHLNDLQRKARLPLRRAPSNLTCPCCSGVRWPDFDAWLEHIAKGMETNKELFKNFCEPNFESWMTAEGLLEWQLRGRWRLEGAEGKRGGRQVRQQRLREADADANGETTDDGEHEVEESGEEEEAEEVKPPPRRAPQRRQHKNDVRTRRRQSASTASVKAGNFSKLASAQ